MPDYLGLTLLLTLAASAIGLGVLIFRARDRGRRAQMRLENHCTACGYDLRASEDRCPECGKRVSERDPREGASPFVLDPKALRENWPADAIAVRIPGPHETPVAVHETGNSTEASLLSQHLESRGIRCKASSRESRLTPIGYSEAMTNWVVVAYSGDADAARAIIDRFRVPPPRF